MSGHPSFFELDALALGGDSPSVREHLESCALCSAHVERLRLPVAVPSLPARAPTPWLRWVPLLGAAAIAASVALVLAVPARAPWLAAKGMPSVAIYVKRGQALTLWDGVSPVRAGDRLRVRIAPEGYDHVAVASRSRSGALVPLFEGPIDDRSSEFLVPGSWEVDAEPGSERLVIGLDHRAVPLAEAAWKTELELPKGER